MENIVPGRRYSLQQQGRYGEIIDELQPLDIEMRFGRKVVPGWHWLALVWVLVHRTQRLNEIGYSEYTEAAHGHLVNILCNRSVPPVRVIDEYNERGHVYECDCVDGSVRRLVFVKRSSEMIKYASEWHGTQSQEVMRALLANLTERRVFFGRNLRTTFGCEPEYDLRYALYFYEVRALLRKLQKKNRRLGTEEGFWEDIREGELLHIPFVPIGQSKDELDIEDWDIGSDGHITVSDEQMTEIAKLIAEELV